jgi:hypothetical protein
MSIDVALDGPACRVSHVVPSHRENGTVYDFAVDATFLARLRAAQRGALAAPGSAFR